MVAMTGITIIVVRSVQHALIMLEKIQNGAVPLDAQALAELVSKSTSGPESILLNIASLAVLLCWIFGIIDSYRIASSQERGKDRSTS